MKDKTIMVRRSDEYGEAFEAYLNDQGLNGNNGANEDKEEEFEEENDDIYHFVDAKDYKIIK